MREVIIGLLIVAATLAAAIHAGPASCHSHGEPHHCHVETAG